MNEFSTKQNCMAMTCKPISQTNNMSLKKPPEQTTVDKKDVPPGQSQTRPPSLNLDPHNEVQSSTSASSHSNVAYVSSNHVTYNNCPSLTNVNGSIAAGGLSTPHYYSPILNAPQSILRPLMTTQPPLYSPILTPQQHTYALPHPSPSAGSFANLTETFRSVDPLSCSSESMYKEATQQSRLNGELSSDKSCNTQTSRQFVLDGNQKKANVQNSCSLTRFPSCAEVVAKTNNLHDQQHVFEEYVRMYGDDGSCRAWGDSSSSNMQSSTLHRNNSYATHQSGSGLNVHGYSDCRLDSSWNRYITGPSSSNCIADAYSVDDGSSPNSKHFIKGFGIGSNTGNNNVTASVSEHNLARAHYEYQAISAGQLASILTYMQPVNFQQTQDGRSECRVPDSRPTADQCDIRSNPSQSNQPSEATKKQLESAPPNVINSTSTSQGITNSIEDTSALSLPTSTQVQMTVPSQSLPHNSNISSHLQSSTESIQIPPTYTNTTHSISKSIQDVKKTPIESTQIQVQPVPSCSAAPPSCSAAPSGSATPVNNKYSLKNSNEAASNFKKQSVKGTSVAEEPSANNFCLLCLASVDESPSHSLIDTLITVPSKVSVSEKLSLMMGYPLPRDMLPSLSICPKCFHLINEVDVLEHRLKVCRREVLLSIESMLERNGMHLGSYKRLQRQQYSGSYQHHEMQHSSYHQHLGATNTVSQNHNSGHMSHQNDAQNYQSLNHIYPIPNQSNQNYVMNQSQMHVTQNYHQHNIHIHSAAHSQLNQHHQDHMSHRTTNHLSQLSGNGHLSDHQSQNHSSHSHMQQHQPMPEEHLKAQLVQHVLNKVPLESDSQKQHQQHHSQHQQLPQPQHHPQHQQHPQQQQHPLQQPQQHHPPQPQQLSQQPQPQQTQQTPQEQTQQQQLINHQHTVTSSLSPSINQHTASHSHHLQPPNPQHSSQAAPLSQSSSLPQNLSQTQPPPSQAASQKRTPTAAPFHSTHSHLEHQHHQPLDSVQEHQYPSNQNTHAQQITTSHIQLSNHVPESNANTNPAQMQAISKYEQLHIGPQESVSKIENINVHSVDTEIQQSIPGNDLLTEDLEHKKKETQSHEARNLILENSHSIPLILPESSDQLAGHPMSVLLSYQHSTERELLLNNYDQSYSGNAGLNNITVDESTKTLQEPMKDLSSTQKVHNIDSEHWNQCNNSVVETMSVGTSNSMNHPECDIDIEECDNLMENVPEVQHEQPLSVCSKESSMEGENVEDAICGQPSFKSETDTADLKSSEENPLDPINSSVSDLNILLPPPPSPPFRPLGPPEGLRNVQDATEYHKPTLLGKNIKAKKHAKLQICRQCDQVFSNRQALIRHIERRHKSVALTHSCDTCHKKFNSERTLKQHNRSHKTYPCKVCSKIFLKKTKLKKHLEEHTQQSLTCKTCNKETSSMQALISHLKTHDRQKKTFVCTICSKNFTCKRNLDHHSLIHSGEKPFSCENCGKGFRNRSNMVNHYNVCIGKFRFMCAVCGRGFVLKSLYERHSAEHEGRYAHNCSICHKGFSKSSDLRHHFNTHGIVSQTRSNPCTVCANQESSSCNANKTKDSKTVCEICGKNVNRKDSMKDHLSYHAGKRHHSCHLCSMSYFYKSNLTFHIKTVHFKKLPFPCTLCRKAFSRPGNYKLHMRTHTGERPYQCKSCGKAFTSSSNYKRHLKCHVTHAQLEDSKQSEDTEIMH